jgi:uncharacterized membrane protein YhaH (DUF805 family)
MFKNPFSFEGRIRRTEYGLTMIINSVVSQIIIGIVDATDGDAAILLIAYIPMIWFGWAQGAKRCHDVGNNGWWQLIPFYGFWLLFQDGQPGSNQYGENPKGIQIIGGQTTQSGTTNPVNTGTGYQGGYSGGHNNPTTNYSSTENPTKTDGYKDGDLYN